jgi:hypothetical protein
MAMLPQLRQGRGKPGYRVLLPVIGLFLLVFAVPTLCPAEPTAPGLPDDEERAAQRLQDLQRRLEAIVKEMESLRRRSGEEKPGTEPGSAWDFYGQSALCTNCHQTLVNVNLKGHGCLRCVPVLSKIAYLNQLFTIRSAASGGEVQLIRKTYPLPRAKAEGLSAFLREYVKAAVLETKVDGDTLTITTTPEVQKGIGQLIALLRETLVGRDLPRELPPDESQAMIVHQRSFQIPVHIEPDRREAIRQLTLYYSTDHGRTWQQGVTAGADAKSFAFVAPADGLYAFALGIQDRQGRWELPQGKSTKPILYVKVEQGEGKAPTRP